MRSFLGCTILARKEKVKLELSLERKEDLWPGVSGKGVSRATEQREGHRGENECSIPWKLEVCLLSWCKGSDKGAGGGRQEDKCDGCQP